MGELRLHYLWGTLERDNQFCAIPSGPQHPSSCSIRTWMAESFVMAQTKEHPFGKVTKEQVGRLTSLYAKSCLHEVM
jgi:hypothetical protein